MENVNETIIEGLTQSGLENKVDALLDSPITKAVYVGGMFVLLGAAIWGTVKVARNNTRATNKYIESLEKDK